MAEYPTEDDYYEDDFEDDDEDRTTSSRPTTNSSRLAKGPIKVTASAPPGPRGETDTEASFSSYHTSDDDRGGGGGAGGIHAILGNHRPTKNRGTDDSSEDEEEEEHDALFIGAGGGDKVYPTEKGSERQQPAVVAAERAEKVGEADPFARELGDSSSSSSPSSSSSITPTPASTTPQSTPAAAAPFDTPSTTSHATTPSVSPVEKTGVSQPSQPSEPSSGTKNREQTNEPHYLYDEEEEEEEEGHDSHRSKEYPTEHAPERDGPTIHDASGGRHSSPVSQRPYDQQQQQQGRKAVEEGNGSGLVHQSNVTSVEMIEDEGDSSRYHGRTSRVDDDGDDEREVRTASVRDNVPLRRNDSTEEKLYPTSAEDRDAAAAGRPTAPSRSADAAAAKSDAAPVSPPAVSHRTSPSSSSLRNSLHGQGGEEPHNSPPPPPLEEKLSTVTPSQSKRHSRDKQHKGSSRDGGDRLDSHRGSNAGQHRRKVTAQAGPSPERAEQFNGEYDPLKRKAVATSSSSSSSSTSSSLSSSHPGKSPHDGVVGDRHKPPIMKTPTPQQQSPAEGSLASVHATASADRGSGALGPWRTNEREDPTQRYQPRRASDYAVESAVAGTGDRPRRSNASGGSGQGNRAPLRKLSENAPLLSPSKIDRSRYTPEAAAARRFSNDSNTSSNNHRRHGSAGGSGGEVDGEDKVALAARIESLKREVMSWSQKIDKKDKEVDRLRRRYYGEDDDDNEQNKKSNGNRRRSSSGSGGGGGGGARSKAPRSKKQQKLDQLRKENRELEAKMERYSGQVVDVPFLVARLDEQLLRFKNRLKELQALRRALDNRDKRAAHTIEEVHRRMPSKEQLRDRQLNEGIYGQASLDLRVRDIRQRIEKTTQSRELLSSKCDELEKEVGKKGYCSISTKDYEQLRDTSEANEKQIHRLKTAITVYSTAVNTILNPPHVHHGVSGARRGSLGSQNVPSTATTPQKSGARRTKTSSKAQQLRAAQRRGTLSNEDAADEADVLIQRESVAEKRALLEEQIADLEAKIAQRTDQIATNVQFVQRNGQAASATLVGEKKQQAQGYRTSDAGVVRDGGGGAGRGKMGGKGVAGKTSEMLFSEGGRGEKQAHPLPPGQGTATDAPPVTGTSKRVVSSGTATLERVANEGDDMHSPEARRSEMDGGDEDTFDLAKARQADTTDAAADDGREEENEDVDSVDEILRTIDQDNRRIYDGGLTAGHATGQVEDDAQGKSAEEEEVVDDDQEFNPATAGVSAAENDGGVEEDESVAEAEDVGDSGRSTPVWLR